jgi:ABC-type uncharacterized transport system substrate-binding protein
MLFGLSVLAEAQQAKSTRTIGFLGQAGGPTSAYEVFRQTLRELGWIEGTNLAIEHRPGGDDSRLAEKAAELVRLKLQAIVTTGGPSTRAVQQATTTIPIVFSTSGDPIESGLIESLARPGKIGCPSLQVSWYVLRLMSSWYQEDSWRSGRPGMRPRRFPSLWRAKGSIL